MATSNQLTTTLTLDIKPFLDAIKRAANQISTLEELRPKFDTTEFNKIQSEIQKLSGEVNVDVTIEGKSIEDAQAKINDISKRQLEIPVDIDTEQINRELGRVGDLRPRISQAELNRVSNQIKNLKPNLNVDFNADRGSINNLQNTITSLNGDVDLKVVVNDTELQDVKTDVRAVEAEDVNVNVLINSEEILRSLDRVRELRQTVLTIPPKTDLRVDANTQQVVDDLEKIANTAKEKISTLPYFLKFEIDGEEKLNELTGEIDKFRNPKVSLELDLQDFQSALNLTDQQIIDIQSKLKGLSLQDANKEVEKFKNTFAEVNKLTFDKAFNNLDSNLRDSFGVAATFENALKEVNLELLSLGKLQIKPKISVEGVEKLSRELRPKFNTTEFQNLQRQIANFKPDINVAVVVDKRSVDAVENEINTLGQDPVDIEVLINSEEIQRSINRVRELRSTALTIPPVTNLKVDSNADIAIKDIERLNASIFSTRELIEKTQVQDLVKAGFNLDQAIIESDRFQESLIKVGLALGQITQQTPLIDIQFNDEELKIAFGLVEEELNKFGASVADIPDFKIDAETLKRSQVALEGLTKAFKEINVEASDLLKKQLIQIFPNIEDLPDNALRKAIEGFNDLGDAIEYVESKAKFTKGFNLKVDDRAKQELLALGQTIERRIPDVKKIFIDLFGDEKAKQEARQVKQELDKLPNQKNIKVNVDQGDINFDDTPLNNFSSRVRDTFNDVITNVNVQIRKIGNALSIAGQEFSDGFKTKEAQEQVNNLADTIDRLIGSKTVTITVPKQKPIADLNDIEKEVNDIPSKKNINVNVDSTGATRASQAVSGVTGFVGQLGSGLLASFSGAAIGAAIANFATQSVRAIVQASDKADELNDKLKLAFTQAGQGIGGFELDTQLQNANTFALDLGDNFGISIARSKELLAQVVGLTGEFGATSESITKASIGIEEATGGLVKAETAAKLFSRSIGNPEDQAALETLAKRFPAIGEAIKGATDPAEKANAVLSNLTGTFESLEEKSRGFGEQFQLLSEVSFGTFATAIVPVFDAFVPILENLRKVVTDNAGAFEQFGERVVTEFIEPLVKQLIDAGPQISEFGATLFELFSISSKISFASLQLGIELLSEAFSLLSAIIEPFKPLLDGLADSFRTALGSITGAFGELESVNQLVSQFSFGLLDAKDSVQGLNPLFDRLKSSFSIIEPIVRSLGDNISNFLIPAFAALKVAIEALFAPLRLYNFLAEQASGLSKNLSFDIDALGITIAKLSVFFTPLLQIANVIKNIRGQRLNTQQLGADIGAVGSQFTGLGKSVQSLVTGYQLLSINQKKLDLGGGGGGGVSKAKKDAGETLSLIEKQIIAYDDLAKVIESRYAVEKTRIDANEKVRSAALGRQLNDNEKLAFELQRINVLTRQQTDLQNALSSQFGISRDSINELAKAFLETGNLASIPINIGGQNIKFDPNDSKNKQSFQKIAELLVQSLNTSIELEGEKAENQVKYAPNVELDDERLKVDLDNFERTLQSQFDDLEFGRVAPIDFNIESIRKDLEAFKTIASNGLSTVNSQLEKNQQATDKTVAKLNELRNAGQGNSVEASNLAGELDALATEYDALTKKSETYNGVLVTLQKRLDTLGDSIQQTISQRFRRLQEANEIAVTFDLNAQGVNEQLIEIERNFGNTVLGIEQFFVQSFARIQAEQVGPIESLKNYETALNNALEDAKIERELAIRDFRRQNDALFAIAESFSRNLAGALAPDNTLAERRFKEREKELNSELELLRANLDINLELNENNLAQRNLTYQEYNAQLLDIERQRGEAQKELDKEIENNRLEGFKRLADEALPAINKQLELETARFTELIKKGTADFETFANKGLETIGLVAAQSLAVAIQQATDLEDVQKLFVKSLVRNILQVLKVQLVAAILQAIFRDVEKAGTAGLLTSTIVGGVLTALFLKAEKEILALAGYEKGGYTGDGGTKDVAGVVHGQEYVVNARATKSNIDALEWVNKTGKTFEEYVAKSGKGALSSDKFQVLNEGIIKNFDSRLGAIESKMYNRENVNIQNYVDTKSMNASINSLAYTMDSRLSSLENTVGRAIRDNATLTKSANQLDVSVYSDPGTTVKHMRKIGKIKGLS